MEYAFGGGLFSQRSIIYWDVGNSHLIFGALADTRIGNNLRLGSLFRRSRKLGWGRTLLWCSGNR